MNQHFKVFDDKFIIKKSNENLNVLIFSIRNIEKAIIPNFVEVIGQNSFEYCQNLKHFEATEDSKLKIIEKDAFCCSNIESLYLPSSLIELKEGWCHSIHDLKSVKIGPNNQYLKIYDDNLIIGKSNIENENYNVLVFAPRSIEKIRIPSFIEIISSCSCECCFDLQEIEIPNDSKIKKIGKNAFACTPINYVYIPSSVTLIGERAFANCYQLQRIEIPNNSNLQVIEKEAFVNASFSCFFMPSHVTTISQNAFCYCEKLLIVEFDENPKINKIDPKVFVGSQNLIIMIPVK